MIVTQSTGVIKYLVSDYVKEKGTIVNRKKPLVHVWSMCEELPIKQKNSEAVQINSCYGYIIIVYFDENLTKIEAAVIYRMCTCDHSVGIWDFLVVV